MENKPNKLYKLSELQTIAGGDNAFVADMVKLFISQNEAALQEIKTKIEVNDYATVKWLLHKMKPSVMVMGIGDVAEIINSIEQMELPAMSGSRFSTLFSQMDLILHEVNEQLRSI